MKKIKAKILKKFKIFNIKFLTEHKKQVILGIVNYLLFTTHFLLHPQEGKQLTLLFANLKFFLGPFLQEQIWVK